MGGAQDAMGIATRDRTAVRWSHVQHLPGQAQAMPCRRRARHARWDHVRIRPAEHAHATEPAEGDDVALPVPSIGTGVCLADRDEPLSPRERGAHAGRLGPPTVGSVRRPTAGHRTVVRHVRRRRSAEAVVQPRLVRHPRPCC